MGVTYTLDSGVERHQEAPDTFEIPPASEREALTPGQLVKLMFRIDVDGEVHVERMWVIVEEMRPEFYVGVLDNDPYCTAVADRKCSSMQIASFRFGEKRPNQAMQPTARRRTASLSMTKRLSFQSSLAPASGGSAPSR
jgi:hypothetical protein